MDDVTRVCTKCGERKALTEFDRVKSARLGRRSDCKTCRSAAMKAWYAANQARQAARERARKASRPEVYRERDRERNQSEHRRGLHEIRTARRRARIAGATVDSGLTRTNLRKQYGDACFYCGVVMTFARTPKGAPRPSNLATLEHVHPVSDGGTHTWDNVVLACWTCNCSKRHSSLDEWMARRK